MMDQSTIKRIVSSQGLIVQFRDVISPRADGSETTYVYVGRHGGMRSLGRIDTVMQLSETELLQRIAAKFGGAQSSKTRLEQ